MALPYWGQNLTIVQKCPRTQSCKISINLVNYRAIMEDQDQSPIGTGWGTDLVLPQLKSLIIKN